MRLNRRRGGYITSQQRMCKSGKWIFVAVILSLGAMAAGQGGPPLIGDDPNTNGKGNWELNIPYIELRAPRQTTIVIPNLDLTYGLSDHVDLNYQGGWLLGKNDDQSWQKGIDNSLIGVKWRFADEDKSGLGVSIFPQLTFNTTRALARSGLVDSGVGFFLPMEMAKSFGKLELGLEAGYQYLEHGEDQWAGSLIVGYQLSERIELLGEARDGLDVNWRGNDLILDVGTRIKLSEHISFLLAGGRSVRSGPENPTLYAYAGFGFTF